MRTTHLGHTGTEISIHGFGAMSLSIQGHPDETQAKRTLHAVLDAGVNFIDTADVYCIDDNDIGHSERLIASVLAEREGKGAVYVATKGGLRRPRGAWVRDGEPRKLRRACEESLRALGTEQIFLYQLHAPDTNFVFEHQVEMLASLQNEGKILHVGLSNVSVDQIRSASAIVRIESVQNRLSPWFREAVDDGVVAECAARGITFLAYSPLGGGRLSRRVGSIPALVAVAREKRVTPGAVTLAWVRAQGTTVVPIPGASTTEHALDSARAMMVDLSEDQVARISAESFPL